jgi:UDP-2-acetamido-2,6-beta-L-arabino-hexul-4-ose reductase
MSAAPQPKKVKPNKAKTPKEKARVLVTGANGFIGKNLVVRLGELERYDLVPFTRDDDPADLPQMLGNVDAVIHLAGENRPKDEAAFDAVNAGLTKALCDSAAQLCAGTGHHVPIILASSAQASEDNPYGRSKLAGEQAVESYASDTGSAGVIFRFPGVFGKWCRPNYNSVVATFCHNIARGEDVRVDNPDSPLRLAYIDDVVAALVAALEDVLAAPDAGSNAAIETREVTPVYETTVGTLADHIRSFAEGREALHVERVGTGFIRALYATYVAALPQEQFAYKLPEHSDPRGTFVEMLKTPDAGQFSFFTALPGVTRGGHYHHTKTEKFLVIRGKASFGFRHLITDERHAITTDGARAEVVQTIPGWSHDITNIGEDELIVMLWANENFDHDKPDTIASET